MQGYNRSGEYYEFVDKYIANNTKIQIKNNKLIYSENVKDLFIDIERVKKSIGIGDYIGSLSHLRRCSERFIDEVLIEGNIMPYKFINLKQVERINLIDDEGLLDKRSVDFIHKIRISGNEAIHDGQADEATAKHSLEVLQDIIHQWISNNNN